MTYFGVLLHLGVKTITIKSWAATLKSKMAAAIYAHPSCELDKVKNEQRANFGLLLDLNVGKIPVKIWVATSKMAASIFV